MRALALADAVRDPEDRDKALAAVQGVIIAAGQAAAKRRTDAAADDGRVSIGVRVRRDRAETYQKAARDSGRSMYRFVLDALDAERELVASMRSDNYTGPQRFFDWQRDG